MDTHDGVDFFNDLDDDEQLDNFLKRDARRERFPARHFKNVRARANEFIGDQDDSRRGFKFTYQAARFEEWWLLDSLGNFYEHQWIADVIQRIKGGKEASVYQCRAGAAIGGGLAAAKVYRPRSLRNLQNDQAYRRGRADLDLKGRRIVNSGQLQSIERKTAYGRELLHESWIAYEFTALRSLFDSGADVPRAYVLGENAILMEFIGDEARAAPSLSETRLDAGEAQQLFDRVVQNIALMLRRGCVHGDLSAYNILYWNGRVTLIDFPQVVAMQGNPEARSLFARDVTRVCEYFQKQGVRCEPARLAQDLWNSCASKSDFISGP